MIQVVCQGADKIFVFFNKGKRTGSFLVVACNGKRACKYVGILIKNNLVGICHKAENFVGYFIAQF